MWSKKLMFLIGLVFVVWMTKVFSWRNVRNLCYSAILLNIPEHDRKDVSRQRFLIDVRPLLGYMAYIPFNWSNWIDLENTVLFENNELDHVNYPLLTSMDMDQELNSLYFEKTTWQEKAMIGQLYCKYDLTIPFRIVHVLESGDLTQYQPWHNEKAILHRQSGHETPAEYFKLYIKPRGHIQNLTEYLFPELDPADFVFRIRELINRGQVSKDHKQTVQSGLQQAPMASKYFHEAALLNDKKKLGTHYDWRFFRRLLSFQERQEALRRIAVHWQLFAEAAEIKYWYAHGSLLGYRWNGMALPWDSDHDIQMPIRVLDRLARVFNRTLVVVGEKGLNKYLIDINPYYVHRTRGNGKNVIDGRFIDTKTGLYVDITGLTQTKPGRSEVSCKNMHTYSISDISQLQRTQFEGHSALVPKMTDKLLSQEYQKYNVPEHLNWHFNSTKRLWIEKSDDDTLVVPELQKRIIEAHDEIEEAGRRRDILKLFELVNTDVGLSATYNDATNVEPQVVWTCYTTHGQTIIY